MFFFALTSTGRGLVGVVDRNSTPHGSQRDVDNVTEPMPLKLGTVRVKVAPGENNLRLPLHGGVPVVLDGIVGAARHHLRDLGPLIAQLLVLDENRAILRRSEEKSKEKKNRQEKDAGVTLSRQLSRLFPCTHAPNPFKTQARLWEQRTLDDSRI